MSKQHIFVELHMIALCGINRTIGHVYYAALALGADDSHVCHSLCLCLFELSCNLISSHFSETWNEIQVICA